MSIIKNRLASLFIIFFSIVLIYFLPTCFVNPFALIGFSKFSHHVVQQFADSKIFEYPDEEELEIGSHISLLALLPNNSTIFNRFGHSFRGIYASKGEVVFEISFDRCLRVVDIYTEDKRYIDKLMTTVDAKTELDEVVYTDNNGKERTISYLSVADWKIEVIDGKFVSCFKSMADAIPVKNIKINGRLFLIIIWGCYYLIWPYAISVVFLAVSLFLKKQILEKMKLLMSISTLFVVAYILFMIAYTLMCFLTCIS